VTPAERLLAWYDRNRRPLPWREQRDPWAVLVSEVMLQQTRAEAVVPYYLRFLARFPEAAALAHAADEELLAHWSGLGYYRRAFALRAAAREIERRGGFPETAAALEALPGIGPYTAAAVASIAFGEAVPVLDGNAVRVLARRLALAGRSELAGARRRLRSAAADLLVPERPGDSNQALMELGATVCRPRRPRCRDCPLAADCRACAAGEPERFPERAARPRPVAVEVQAAAVERGGGLLLVRRAAEEPLLGGLWELPAIEGTRPEPARFAAHYGGAWRFGAARARIRHAVTCRALAITAWSAEWTPEVAESASTGFFAPAAARALPLTGAARKLLAALAPVSGSRARRHRRG
jgi:A/G-specific adenine glycosylase